MEPSSSSTSETEVAARRLAYRRWLIVGPSGAGKSTLSRRLAELLALPIVHLDRHYWHADWVPTPTDEWERVVDDLSAAEAWVMDGNYSGTISRRLPRADIVVLLDFHPLLCAARVIKRYFGAPRRPDIPDDVTDKIWDLEFFWYILSYRWRSRPKVLRRIARHPHVELVHLRNDREVESFVESLAEAAGTP